MATTHVWPPATYAKERDWSVDELKSGDLIFCSNASGADWIEVVHSISGNPWRHVGALVELDDGLHVIESSFGKFCTRPLDEFFAAYDRFGAVRLALAPSTIDRATSRMHGLVGDENVYAWDDLMLAGFACIPRRGIYAKHRPRVRAALEQAALAATEARLREGVRSFTCSNLIYWGYLDDHDECALDFLRWRTATAWPPRLATLDELLSDGGTHLDHIYADATLLELYELTQGIDRGSGDERMTLDQYGECIRVLIAAAGGWLAGRAPEHLHTRGRWVTPGDIWHSPDVARLGSLSPAR